MYESEDVVLTFNYSDVVNYLLEIGVENQEAVELKQYIEEQGLLTNEIKINEIPIYYIGDLIELGNVKVYDKESNGYVEEIEVEERNEYCGPLCGSGHKYYRTKSGNSPFLSIWLWIS